MGFEGSVVLVSLQPSSSPSKCIISFAVGPPVLVELPSGNIKPLPALILGEPTPKADDFAASIAQHGCLSQHSSNGFALLLVLHISDGPQASCSPLSLILCTGDSPYAMLELLCWQSQHVPWCCSYQTVLTVIRLHLSGSPA